MDDGSVIHTLTQAKDRFPLEDDISMSTRSKAQLTLIDNTLGHECKKQFTKIWRPKQMCLIRWLMNWNWLQKCSSHNSLFSFHVNRKLQSTSKHLQHVYSNTKKTSRSGKFLKVPGGSAADDLYALTLLWAAKSDGSSFSLPPRNTTMPLDLQERCQQGSLYLVTLQWENHWAFKIKHFRRNNWDCLLIPDVRHAVTNRTILYI